MTTRDQWATDAVGPATLCFIVSDEKVLLIEKKRGTDVGLMNAPGGKILPEESPVTCIIREVREEVGIVIPEPEKCGEILFRIGDESFSFVHVFRTDTFFGTPAESSEGRPEWIHCDELPWENMWSGDRLWIPRVLRGEKFRGRVTFSPDTNTVCSYSFNGVSGFSSQQ